MFVGGLSPDTKMGKSLPLMQPSMSSTGFAEHLCEYFAQFGNVESATVKFDKSGRSKGFGFVLFEDRDSTDKVRKLHTHRTCLHRLLSMAGVLSRFACYTRQACGHEVSASP